MAKYFYGSDLYSDLFLNNNREMYIKMLLLDQDEPEIDEFYIYNSNVSGGKASSITIPYGTNTVTSLSSNFCPTSFSEQTITPTSIYNIELIPTNPAHNGSKAEIYVPSGFPSSSSGTYLLSADVVVYPDDSASNRRASLIFNYSDGSSDTFENYETFPDGVIRTIYISGTTNPLKTVNSMRLRFGDYTTGSGSRHLSAYNVNIRKVSISSASLINIYDNDALLFNAIDVDVAQGATISIGSTFLYGITTYANLNVTNFYTSNISTILNTNLPILFGSGSAGIKYNCNPYNKMIISNKSIQGNVMGGSLRVDGNSPMRRTIDLSCIVDKAFGTNADLKLHDFDNKKVKIFIGIKDSWIGANGYDYAQYFANNGTQKDLNEIIWFKLGVFIPRNINIKHSTDSYSISLTAQDKMSSLDGSFGGVLGEGIEFRDPTSGENTSFYDTIIDSFSRYTSEPSNKISISFNDDFELFKAAPSALYNYVTAGSSLLYVEDADNIFPGMGVQAPGVYSTAKVAGVSSMGTYDIILMDDIAYDTVNTTQQIFKNSVLIRHGATFTYPSYKNFFAIEPLTPTGGSFSFFAKPTTINFKNSNETYDIYTTISDWSPTTWGVAKSNFKKAQFSGFASADNVNITGQGGGLYFIIDATLSVGDYIFTGANVGTLSLAPYTYYSISSANQTLNRYVLKRQPENVFILPVTNITGLNIPAKRFIKGDLSIPGATSTLDTYTSQIVYSKAKGAAYLVERRVLVGDALGRFCSVTVTPFTSSKLTATTFYLYTNDSLIFQASSKYAIVANNSTKTLSTYTFNASNGPGTVVQTISVDDKILGMVVDSSENLFVSTQTGRIIKYNINSATGAITEISRKFISNLIFRLIEIDSSGNIFAYSDINNTRQLVKYDSNLSERISIRLDVAWFSNNIVGFNGQTAPDIYSISFDDFDNLYLITDGKYLDESGQSTNLGSNFIVLNNGDLTYAYKADFYDPNIDFFSTKIVSNADFAYVRSIYYSSTYNWALFKSALNFPASIEKINAIKELAPQTDSTIVKSSSDKVSGVLEDVKSQLGILQYYYDYDGNFVMKEDKRLTFYDPNYQNLSPYSFNYEDYNVNVRDVPFEFDFVANKNLITDYNNGVDLSTFKNDFFIYGIKKGLDVTSDSGNIPMLYHIMIDDLTLKDIPNSYKHPWQQYFIDQGLVGTTYANFIYFKELKENFEFKDTRDYKADPAQTYVEGEYIVVNAASAGTSSSATYLVYQVITGGTPSLDSYPNLKDGTIEYINNDLPANTGLSVKFYSSLKGANARTFQGIYKPYNTVYSVSNLVLRRGSYFTVQSTVDNVTYIYKVTDIVSAETGSLSDDIPISVDLAEYSFGLKTKTPKKNDTFDDTVASSNIHVDLGAYSSCKISFIAIEQYSTGYAGIFRSNNTGTLYNDFVYDNRNGDPSSWAYYYDIVNIIGNRKIDDTVYPAKTVAVGITSWAPSTKYYKGELVYSDGKIYEALTQGTSGNDPSYAPTGFGDSQNLIRDLNQLSGPNKLIWHLNQISIDFNKMKVSAIGSRKSSVNDKDINILFSQKDALAYFQTYGYYFVVINDLLGYSTYSDEFHNRLENLIKQYKILYPNIKLIFVPQSLINSSFIINKLTALKDAFSVLKRTFYLNFVNGQSISISAVPIYSMEPLGIIRVVDEDADVCGNFLLTDYSIPLSNEGPMSIGAVKTHPYDDGLTVIPESVTDSKLFDNASSKYDGNSIYV